jgi:hypothetical protein
MMRNNNKLDSYLEFAINQDDQVLKNIAKQIKKINQQKSNDNPAIKKYASVLKAKIGMLHITSSHRKELDELALSNALKTKDIILIEEKIRKSFGRGTLNWENELRRSIRKMLDENTNKNKKIKNSEKLTLENIYGESGRLSLSQIEKSIIEEQYRIQVLKQDAFSSKTNKRKWFFGATIIFIVIASVILSKRHSQLESKDILVDDSSEVLFKKSITVSGSITYDTTWNNKTTYVLSGPVFVEGKAILTIEPGTLIRGGFASGLIITKNAKIYARGTKDAPIIFTSAKSEGEKERGDWGGIVMLGNAIINQEVGNIEGIDQNDVRGEFGGNDDSDNCGVLEYVRIEFAGLEVFKDNELNGLTMGGCGDATRVNHVQVHQAFDDGIEMFGGTADLKNIIITGARDDSLDWDMGWRGRVQFLVVQQYDDAAYSAQNDHSLPRCVRIVVASFFN